MATYNGAQYIQEQLQSFVDQTRQPDELVITDDCSTDNTLEIIKAFAATAPFEVCWERNEKNLGYTGNFNQALMRTTGDLVFLSDHDDVWFPDKLERMERYAIDNPDALVVMNDAALTDANLKDTGLTKQGQIASMGTTNSCFVMGCCAVVRRELLDICLPIPAEYKGHDDWIVKMAEGVGRKHMVSDVLQWYRRHDENVSQMIANRTSKVTRGMIFRRNLRNKIRGENLQNQLVTTFSDQKRCFLQGIANASARADAPLSDLLTAYANQLEQRFAAVESRRLVRIKARYARLPDILKLWKKGAYVEFSGVKSAVRDLLFR